MEELISQLHIMEYINIYLILALLGIGFIIKHTKKLENIPNNYIPIILYILSMIYEIITLNSYDKISIINGIMDATIASAIAIGIHSSGKQIFKSNNISKILFSDDNIEDNNEENTNDE